MVIELVTLLVLVTGCAELPQPQAAAAANVEARTPVVLVPGITGTKLRDQGTGKVHWGTGRALLGPWDHGHAIALPIADAGGPRLEAFEVITRISLAGVVRRQVYAPLVRLMEVGGYRLGDLRQPQPKDTFFLFPYDWRRDSVLAARQLVERLEALRRARGEARLEVVLVCQSAAVHICRYLLRYGGASLDDAEAGKGSLPATIEVTKLILIGPSTGGSLRNLRWLNRGRRYVPLIGRRWSPETLFTFVSLYQDLPFDSQLLFLDSAGNSVETDLYDPQSWQDYGWSVFAPAVRRRLERHPRPDLFGSRSDRVVFLRRTLGRAVRFHRLLARDLPTSCSTRYYLVQNTEVATAGCAVVVNQGGVWRTFFPGDRGVDRDPRLRALATALGDGHATRSSQLLLTPREEAAIAAPPLIVPGAHFEMINLPETHRYLEEVVGPG